MLEAIPLGITLTSDLVINSYLKNPTALAIQKIVFFD